MDTEALLHLLFVSDSALPTGAFTASSGWEAAVHDGLLRGPRDTRGWLGAMLDEQLAPIELPVMARAHRASTVRQARLVSRFLDRLVPLPGWREASRVTGARLLRLCSEPARDWHRAVALGWLARRHNVPPPSALAVYAQAALWAQAQVGVRLGVWSTDDAAAAVTALAPQIGVAASSATSGRIRPTCAVSWEISGMRQPLLATRLFAT